MATRDSGAELDRLAEFNQAIINSMREGLVVADNDGVFQLVNPAASRMLGYAPGERKFDIRAYRAPRLRSQIVFVRKGYGPGDEVRAVGASDLAAVAQAPSAVEAAALLGLLLFIVDLASG